MKTVERESGLVHYGDRIIRLPDHGTLLISTDIHGNYDDYLRMRSLFEDAYRRSNGDAWMLFTGDLIHGPPYTQQEWPDYLGTYYSDNSQSVLDDFLQLRDFLGDRILTLIGNHEHSHVGGPKTHKFGRRPSEAGWFEQAIGPEVTARYAKFFRTLPLICVAPCGIVVSHGAPRVMKPDFEEVATAGFDGYDHLTAADMADIPIVGELLWCRSTGPLVVRRYLRELEVDGCRNSIAIYGHDPVREGYDKASAEQLCLSTSYGLKNVNKRYLELDLSKHYGSVDDLRDGIELKSLWE